MEVIKGNFTLLVEWIGLAVDGAGVAAIVLGILSAVLKFSHRGPRGADSYTRFHQDLGRGILLGLEFLVAADIIRTVAVTPTLESVLVLGLIVLIRTFLSFTLQVEVEGRLPWQKPPVPTAIRAENEGGDRPFSGGSATG